MPFAGYKDFEECVSKNSDKENPKGYCATVMRKVEKKEENFFGFIPVEFKGEYFEGYLSTPHLDMFNDIVTPKCLNDMAQQINESSRGKVKGSLEHNFDTLDSKIPVSKLLSAIVDEKGLRVTGELNPDHPQFDKVKNMIKGGWLDGLSIEYRATDFIPKEKNNGKRVLNGVMLMGYGHTARPANAFCNITDFFTKAYEKANEGVEEKEVDTMAEVKTEAVKPEEKTAVPTQPVEDKSITELKAQIAALQKKNEELEKAQVEFKAFMSKKDEIKTAVKEELEKKVPEQKNIVPPEDIKKEEFDFSAKSYIQSFYGKPQ